MKRHEHCVPMLCFLCGCRCFSHCSQPEKKKTVHRECVCRKQDAHTGIEEEAGVDILLCAHSQASTTEIQPLFASGVVVCK